MEALFKHRVRPTLPHSGAETQANGKVLNVIWQQCISCLEGEISEQQLNTWILPLQAEQELNTLKLLAPNRFVMDWVRKHFLERIRELVDSLDDSKSISVSLAIGSQARVIEPDEAAPVPPPRAYRSSGLSESHRFKNFVEGKSNQLARAASIQISSNPGSEYNPLYIYGGVDLEKPT